MKLHLGCGPRYLPGYIHVDVKSYPHINHIHDITESMTSIFEAESIDEIYACHVLEHIPRKKIISTLTNWNKLLKIGGVLRLSVPDFEAVVKVYRENSLSLHELLLGFLYGGQRDQWDFHTFTFDFVNMQRLLGQLGFGPIERYRWEEFLPSGYDDYSRAYLPHEDNIFGRLMSLNIVASKISLPTLDQKELLSKMTKLPAKEI